MNCASILDTLIDYHLSGSGAEDNDVLEMFDCVREPEDVPPFVKSLKLEGNELFKQSKFDCALNKYAKAIKALCFAVPFEREAEIMVEDLAISLSLNIAICALKLGLYDEVIEQCSLVVQFDPSNVKAMFRRATALIQLGKLGAAYVDLLDAQNLEPKNKEVEKLLNQVKHLIEVKKCDMLFKDYSNPQDQKDESFSTKMKSDTGKNVKVPLSFDPLRMSHVKERIIEDGDTHSPLVESMEVEVDATKTDVKRGLENGEEDSKMLGKRSCLTRTTSYDKLTDNLNKEPMDVDKVVSDEASSLGKCIFVNQRNRNRSMAISPSDLKKIMEGQAVQYHHP